MEAAVSEVLEAAASKAEAEAAEAQEALAGLEALSPTAHEAAWALAAAAAFSSEVPAMCITQEVVSIAEAEEAAWAAEWPLYFSS